MIWLDLSRAAVVAPIGLFAPDGRVALPVILAVAVAVSLASGPFSAARNALVPQVVAADQLTEANALLQAGFRASFFIGPLFLVPSRSLGLGSAYACDAVTFLLSALSLANVSWRPIAGQRPTRSWEIDIREGLRVLRCLKDVRIMLLMFTVQIFLASGFMKVGLVALVASGVNGGDGRYGLLRQCVT